MPTMLYRPGTEINPGAWNEKIDTCIVDEGDLEAVLKDGWYRHPKDFPPPAPPPAPKAVKVPEPVIETAEEPPKE